jgi:hypothetical protein
MKIEYFGTNLNSAGHFLFELDNGYIGRNLRSIYTLPFNPEGLPYSKKYRLVDGTVKFYSFAGFTICAIAGSCSDGRPGSKSVFFVEEEISFESLKNILIENEAFKKIAFKMPFGINW